MSAAHTALVLATRHYDVAGLSERLRSLDLHVEHCQREPRFALEDQTHARFIILIVDLATGGDRVTLAAVTERLAAWCVAVVPERTQIPTALLGGADAAVLDDEWDALAGQLLAFMRRERKAPAETAAPDSGPPRIGNVVAYEEQASITVAGVPLTLAPVEYRVLLTLIRRPGSVVPSRDLMAHASPGITDPRQLTQNLKTHIFRIRKKLRAACATVEIVTRRDFGYLIVEN